MHCSMRIRTHLQLERHSLQCLGAALHHLDSCRGGAGETDFLYSGMGCEPGAQVFVAAQCLNDARREEVQGNLSQLEATVRRERPGHA